MGTSLNGLTPAGTYLGLIKTGDNAPIDGTLKTLSDGNGNNLPMEASTTGINFTGNVLKNGFPLATPPSGVSGAIQFSDGSAFASDAANLFWDDTNNRLGIGTNAPIFPFQVKTTQANANGSIGFTNTSAATIIALTDTGSAVTQLQFRASSYNFTDCDGMRISQGGYGNVATAMLQVIGKGSTSATTSLLVQNSAGTELFKVQDNGNVALGGLSVINTEIIGNPYFSGTAYGPNFLIQPSGAANFGSSGAAGASAILQADSTTRGFLPPRMTTTQRDAITSPATGLKIYNTTLGTTDTYDGATWQRFGQQTLIKGSGSTSATTSFLVQDSNASEILKLVDSGRLSLGANNYIGSGGEWRCDINFVVNGIIQNSNSGYVQLSKAYAQSGLVAGTTTLNASAILEGSSTTQGFLPPRMTTTQKNAIATPAAGLVVYDTTTNKLCCYDGSTWNDLF